MNDEHPTLCGALRKRADCEEFQKDFRGQSIQAVICHVEFNTGRCKAIDGGKQSLCDTLCVSLGLLTVTYRLSLLNGQGDKLG